MKLWQQILVAMIAGFGFGILLNNPLDNQSTLAVQVLKPLGDVFVNLLKMLVVPLVFCSLITGIASMDGDLKRMGRIGYRTFGIYLLTTAIAISIGLVIAHILAPGVGIELTPQEAGSGELKAPEGLLVTFMNTIKGIVPTNPFDAFAKGSILQIIIFALLFGIAMNKAGERAEGLRQFFASAAQVMYELTAMVMKVAPIGVFALMAWVAAKFGIKALLPLMKLIIAVYVACVLHAIIVIGMGAKIFGGVSLKRFFQATLEPLSFAFVSASSSATLSLTINAVHQKLGVSRRISDFVLPLGATINMDGTAIYQGVCAVFVAQIYGIDLSLGQYVTMIVTCTLASIGTAGVPGAGLVMLTMVLASVGLPLEGIVLVSGIDRILDMARTSINVLGDCMVATVIGKREKEIETPTSAS